MLTGWNINLRAILETFNDKKVDTFSYFMNEDQSFHEILSALTLYSMMVTQQRIKSIRLDYWSIVVYLGSIKLLDPSEKDVIKMVTLLRAGNSAGVGFRPLFRIKKSDDDFETVNACFVSL
tara:strand:+ start:609 stop:971 length:363 start_codon:yes stop_codon:yes gene_type:complete